MPRIYLTYRPEESILDEVRAIAGRLEQDWGQDCIVLSPTYTADDILALAEGVRRCDALLMLIGPFWSQLVNEERRHILQDPGDYQYTELMTALELNMWISVVRLRNAPPIDASLLPPDLKALAREDSFSLDMAQLDEAIQALKERIRFSRRRQVMTSTSGKGSYLRPPLEDPRRAAPTIHPQVSSILDDLRLGLRTRPLVVMALVIIVAIGAILLGSSPSQPRLLPTVATQQAELRATEAVAVQTMEIALTLEALALATRAAASATAAESTRVVEEANVQRLLNSVLAPRLAISRDTMDRVETLQTMRIPRDASPDAYRWVVFSANGRYLFTERKNGLTRYDMTSGQAQAQSQVAAGLVRLAVLNSGDYLALLGDGRIAQVEWVGGADRAPRVSDLAIDHTSDVASDGELIALGFEDRVVIQRRQGQGWVRVRTLPLASPPMVMVASSGKLAVAMQDNSLLAVDMNSGETLLNLPADLEKTQAMNLSADGNVVALAYSNGLIEVSSLRTGESLARFSEPGVRDVALNANGTLIATASSGNGVVLRTIGPQSQRRTLYHPDFLPHAINFSSDDRTIVANDDQKVTIYGIPAR